MIILGLSSMKYYCSLLCNDVFVLHVSLQNFFIFFYFLKVLLHYSDIWVPKTPKYNFSFKNKHNRKAVFMGMNIKLDIKYLDLTVIQISFFSGRRVKAFLLKTLLFSTYLNCVYFFSPSWMFLWLKYQTKPFIIHPLEGIDALDGSWALHLKQILIVLYFSLLISVICCDLGSSW